MGGIGQIILLAAVAIFLILRLRSVLGTREGFEKPRVQAPTPDSRRDHKFEVIDGDANAQDQDILDHAAENSETAETLTKIKAVEPGFGVGDFVGGARGAYEMILMAYENGDLSDVEGFLDPEVLESFNAGIDMRKERGLTIDATFIGVREVALQDAKLDADTNEAELTVRFVGEMTSIVRDNAGDIVEGSETEVKRQRDVWTFARIMGSQDPNWKLVATGL